MTLISAVEDEEYATFERNNVAVLVLVLHRPHITRTNALLTEPRPLLHSVLAG